jgi:hypothetical protein
MLHFFPFFPFIPGFGLLVPLLVVGLLVWLLLRSQAPVGPPSTLSADGRWWWDGRRWVPAVSADGAWRWNGTSWEPTAEPSAS